MFKVINNNKIRIYILLITNALCIEALSREPVISSPTRIVKLLLVTAEFHPTNEDRLKWLSPLFSKKLNSILLEWITANKKIISISYPDGWGGDPISLGNWPISEQKIEKTNFSDNVAKVTVHTVVVGSKIYSGYSKESIYLFFQRGRRWILTDVKFSIKYQNIKMPIKSTLIDTLKNETKRFEKEYRFRKTHPNPVYKLKSKN